jgi:glycosyltransferase involved in cell wall biosynthesis
VRQSLGVDARLLYPPVLDPGPLPAWKDRRTAFLSLGRISPEKDYERSMRILSRVREHVPDLTFTIVGTWDRYGYSYVRHLQRVAASLGSWITFRSNLSREELRSLIATLRYGIHAMGEEHFGMAPAEMVRAGMIVWVPRGGGQVEIVGDEPPLSFGTDEDAIEKIQAVLASPAEQERLRAYLKTQAERFGTERFVREVRDIVATFNA